MNYERKPIPGYEGFYESDTNGQIWSVRAERFLAQSIKGQSGYFGVQLSVNSVVKQAYVHELILSTFAGPRPKGFQCRHLNDNKSDNRPENLQWGSPMENSSDRIRNGGQARGSLMGTAKLTEADVLRIRSMAGSLTQDSIAKQFGVSFSLVSQIIRRRIWNHV